MAPQAFAKFVISVNIFNPTAGSLEVMVMSWIGVLVLSQILALFARCFQYFKMLMAESPRTRLSTDRGKAIAVKSQQTQ
jgi:hypothetical protein